MTDKEATHTIELTAAERAGLERVASAEPPYSQRAQALLALADGADLAGAGITSGLTINQVRYWFGRFGPRRLSIFPDALLEEQAAEEAVQTELPLLDAPEKAPLLEAPEFAGELPETVSDYPKAAAATAAASAGGATALKLKKDKGTKDQKSKKDKKTKKDKKDKKSKKGKDSKKSKKDKKSKKSKKSKKDKKDKKSKKKKDSKKSKKDKKSKKGKKKK